MAQFTETELKRAIRKNLNTASQHLTAAQKLVEGHKPLVPAVFRIRVHHAVGRMQTALEIGRRWWGKS